MNAILCPNCRALGYPDELTAEDGTCGNCHVTFPLADHRVPSLASQMLEIWQTVALAERDWTIADKSGVPFHRRDRR